MQHLYHYQSLCIHPYTLLQPFLLPLFIPFVHTDNKILIKKPKESISYYSKRFLRCRKVLAWALCANAGLILSCVCIVRIAAV